MSAPFFLGKVIDTIYTTGADTETMTASLTSLCIMLTGVFLCGGAANAARVYLMQTSGETQTQQCFSAQNCQEFRDQSNIMGGKVENQH